MKTVKGTMRAMVLQRSGEPLRVEVRDIPKPGPAQVLVRVAACGVCRTDLHVVDGELPDPRLPIVPGHEIVGRIEQAGADVNRFSLGQRVGIPWLGATCGACSYCREGQENLCDRPSFTGYHIDGGYAEYAVANADYCFQITGGFSDAEAAPLLCAGLIGYRSLKLAGPGHHFCLYGFGAAAHILVQAACHQGRSVYAFTRPGDEMAQEFARRLGCVWAGGSDE